MSLAPVGVIQAPRVKLATGLTRTREKSTSSPTTRLKYPTPVKPQKFHQGRVGRQAGVKLAMTGVESESFSSGRRPRRHWRGAGPSSCAWISASLGRIASPMEICGSDGVSPSAFSRLAIDAFA